MALQHGYGAIASSSFVFLFVASCTASYTPQLEIWPSSADASSPALPGYDARVDEAAPGLTPITPVASGDAESYATQSETGTPEQPAETDASMDFVESGNSTPETDDAAPHPRPDAGPPRQHAATIVVTTVDDFQCYSPANVGAIWIAQSSGAFVKTLQLWAQTRIEHLVLWNSATSAAGLPRNTVDAITGATAPDFGTHVVYWDFTDTTGKVVPEGTYRVYFETDDQNVPGPNTFVTFTKGAAPATFTYPDTPSFINLEVIVMP